MRIIYGTIWCLLGIVLGAVFLALFLVTACIWLPVGVVVSPIYVLWKFADKRFRI